MQNAFAAQYAWWGDLRGGFMVATAVLIWTCSAYRYRSVVVRCKKLSFALVVVGSCAF